MQALRSHLFRRIILPTLLAASLPVIPHAFAQQQPQPVGVVNPPSRPVPTFDVDGAARHPYRCARYTLVPAGVGFINIECDPVPSGVRLAIEYVAVKIVTSKGNTAWVTIGVGPEVPPVNSIHLVPTRVLLGPTEDWLIVSQQVTFYVEPGEIPSMRSNRVSTTAEAVYEYTLQGSLVPIR